MNRKCRSCGARIPRGKKFCGDCGSPLTPERRAGRTQIGQNIPVEYRLDPRESVMISPHFDSKYLENPTLDKRIDVFEDRIRHWIIDQAKTVLHQPHGIMASLLISSVYFELYAIYSRGEDSGRRSKDFFTVGFNSVFNIDDESDEMTKMMAEAFYHHVRCGLYHFGTVKPRIALDGETDLLSFTVDQEVDDEYDFSSAVFNPAKWIDVIDRHFAKYIDRLRDDRETELRSNFLRAWQIVHKQQ